MPLLLLPLQLLPPAQHRLTQLHAAPACSTCPHHVQTGLADVLRGSAAVASSHGAERSVTSVSTPHAIPSSSRSSFEERSAGHLPPLSPPRPVPAEPWSVAAGQRGAAPEVSPFALQASALEGTSSPPPGPLSPVALSPTAALLRQPSRGSVASAVLRQLSLQSDLSRVLEGIDNQPLSPLDCEGERPARGAPPACLPAAG